ncbi:MAG: VWA domain-containing protein [Candidatus Zixiibacteriota bacterium]|nr:MAG: VWA domain-containing protein [candidate division Zixibacteria bacterium]
MPRAYGIDLGTTFSAIATLGPEGRPQIIKNAEGEDLTPSVIYLGGSEPVVGREAKLLQAQGEGLVAAFFKRVMGDPNWRFPAGDLTYTPVDLSALVLKKLKQDAETALGEPVLHAVITVPAYFSDLQRRNTIEAGKAAGLNVLRIINEPTAAAIAYGTERLGREAVILVYDLGGGTFDVSLVRLAPDSIEVMATDGNHELGGKDWDDAILRWALRRFEEEHGFDPLGDSIALGDLLQNAEAAKKTLSAAGRAIIAMHSGGASGRYELNRAVFEEVTAPLMEMTLKLADQVVADAGLTWSDLTGTLCIGGSTRMPMVHRCLESRTGKKPLGGINVDEAVALGAALQAGRDLEKIPRLPGEPAAPPPRYLGPRPEIRDVMSHSLGMVAVNEDRSRYINSILIPKNRPVPSRQNRPYQLRTSARRANEMEVYITQGESLRPLDCTLLGKYRFLDIPHTEGRDQAIVDVSYEYDQNGVVKVTAVERFSGRHLRGVVEPVPQDMSWLDQPPEEIRTFEHLSVMIAVDLSGSMSGEPLAKARQAAERFAAQMDLAHTSIGLMVVADRVKIIQGLCQDARKISRAIGSLRAVMSSNVVGGGNEGQPFTEARAALHDCRGLKFLIVLTDGVWSYQEKAIAEAKKCHAAEIEVVALGFGSADRKFLRAIASSEEGALLTSLDQLGSSFDRIAQVLTESDRLAVSPSERKGLNFFR